MKIYLILEYKSDTKGNHWAETQAFTSPRERDRVFSQMPKEADVECQDIGVNKRAYRIVKYNTSTLDREANEMANEALAQSMKEMNEPN